MRRHNDVKKRRHVRVKACGDESSEAQRRELGSVRKCEGTKVQSCQSVVVLAPKKTLGREREDADLWRGESAEG